MLKIVTVPNNILTTPTKPVDKIDDKLKKLIAEMEKTLIAQTDPPGVGLAAPQIGENIALFITKPSVKKKDIHVFINPKILASQGEALRGKSIDKKSPKGRSPSGRKKRQPLEGCLSVNRIWSTVKRAYKVLLEYHTLTYEVKSRWFQGFEATIIQHEVDHLNGILFTQRALEQKSPLYEEKDGELKKMDY